MVPERWSVNRLACELAMDRRVLARKLAGLEPIEERKGKTRVERFYWLKDVVGHLAASEDDSINLARERARLTKLQADKAQLEIQEIVGEVCRMPLIESHWAALVSAFRAKLLALPSRAAAAIAPPDKLQATTDTIQGFVFEALHEIAGDGIPHEIRQRAEKHKQKDEQP